MGTRCFITRDNPQGRFLASVLSEHLEDLVIIVEASGSNSLSKAKKQVLKHLKKSSLHALAYGCSLPFHLCLEALYNHTIERHLGAPKSFPEGLLSRFVKSINDSETHTLLEELKPVSTVVYGSSIIRKKSIRLLGKVLNCHMGIVPEYRGAKSEFWALSHGEPHLVGFSIHELVEALDAGAVMHRETLPSPSTSPAQCRAESLKRLGQQLPNIWIQHERGETKPLPQESKGQLYSTPSLSQKIIWALKTGHLA